MARDYFFAFGSGNPATNASLAPTFITFVNSAGTTFAAPAIAEKYPGSGLYYVSYGATQTMAFVLDGATSGLATSDRYIAGVFDPYDQFGVTLNAAYALGVTGVAIGTTLIGYGNSLLSLGNSNIALGNSNIALGFSNIALGNSNIALGNTNLALEGIGLTAMAGYGITLVAQGATVVGIGNTLLGLGSSFGGLAAILGTTASSYGSTNVDPVDVMGYLKRSREFNEGNQTYTKATGLLDFYVRGGVTLLIEKTISDNSTNTTKT